MQPYKSENRSVQIIDEDDPPDFLRGPCGADDQAAPWIQYDSISSAHIIYYTIGTFQNWNKITI
jgi:hypothetical protein